MIINTCELYGRSIRTNYTFCKIFAGLKREKIAERTLAFDERRQTTSDDEKQVESHLIASHARSYQRRQQHGFDRDGCNGRGSMAPPRRRIASAVIEERRRSNRGASLRRSSSRRRHHLDSRRWKEARSACCSPADLSTSFSRRLLL